jgi:citrate lyase subunit beta/citryl-CoA lyase
MKIRSLLFVPGNDDRKTKKAFTLGADAVALDLEDAVARSQKVAARAPVARVVEEQSGSPSLRVVRVNGFQTELTEEDVKAVYGPSLDAILLPMVERVEHVERLDRILTALEERDDRRARPVAILLLIETARGVLDAADILQASPRVAGTMFGPGDYTLDVGTRMTVEGYEVLYARSHLVAAARAAGLPAPIDGPFVWLDDLDGYESNARDGKRLGYGGKAVIHPSQLPVCHEVFSVSSDDLAWAQRVTAAFAEAERQGIASIKLANGDFVDYPLALRAQQLLRDAKRD